MLFENIVLSPIANIVVTAIKNGCGRIIQAIVLLGHFLPFRGNSLWHQHWKAANTWLYFSDLRDDTMKHMHSRKPYWKLYWMTCWLWRHLPEKFFINEWNSKTLKVSLFEPKGKVDAQQGHQESQHLPYLTACEQIHPGVSPNVTHFNTSVTSLHLSVRVFQDLKRANYINCSNWIIYSCDNF